MKAGRWISPPSTMRSYVASKAAVAAEGYGLEDPGVVASLIHPLGGEHRRPLGYKGAHQIMRLGKR